MKDVFRGVLRQQDYDLKMFTCISYHLKTSHCWIQLRGKMRISDTRVSDSSLLSRYISYCCYIKEIATSSILSNSSSKYLLDTMEPAPILLYSFLSLAVSSRTSICTYGTLNSGFLSRS